MRKLKLQVQLSVDGFIAGPNGEMDWMEFNWDSALNEYVTQLTRPVDTILLGRKLAEGFIPHWTSLKENPETAEDFVHKMVDTHKVVFTKTSTESQWKNTVLANGDLTAEITSLKNQEGNDMIVYGGGSFVSSLIKERLIDEYHLFINPVVLGSGMPIFQDVAAKQELTLVHSQAFECGIVVLHYAPKGI